MPNTDRQAVLTGPVSAMVIVFVGAALLILLGIVFQLGELGYAHLTPDSSWVLSVMVECVWNVLAIFLSGIISSDVLRFWPVLLMLTGGATVLALNPKIVAESMRDSRGGTPHGRG